MTMFTETERLFFLESWQHALTVLLRMPLHERINHFNMAIWGKRTECGTVACLAGHCALDRWFIKNRNLSFKWCNDILIVFACDYRQPYAEDLLDHTFGGKFRSIFYSVNLSHADIVRRVRRVIAELGGEQPVPLGWGMCGVPQRHRVCYHNECHYHHEIIRPVVHA